MDFGSFETASFRYEMLRKGAFWAWLLVLILVLSTFRWGNTTVDVNLHDTYFVVTYSRSVIPNMLFFSVIGICYHILDRNGKRFIDWYDSLYVFATYLTTFLYLLVTFGNQQLIERDLQVGVTGFLANLLVFLAAQLFFFIRFLRRRHCFPLFFLRP